MAQQNENILPGIHLTTEARDLVQWFEHADLTQSDALDDPGRVADLYYTRLRQRIAAARANGRMPRGLFHDLKELREAIKLRVDRLGGTHFKGTV